MPKEYIEREKLMAELQKKVELSHNAMRAVTEEDFEDIINDMPAADVVEVKHGQWIDGKCGHYKICSECNQIADFYFDYCPNCGAKMDGKDGE